MLRNLRNARTDASDSVRAPVAGGTTSRTRAEGLASRRDRWPIHSPRVRWHRRDHEPWRPPCRRDWARENTNQLDSLSPIHMCDSPPPDRSQVDPIRGQFDQTALLRW